VLLLSSASASAAARFWKSGGTCSGAFNDTNCWAQVSGGATGFSVPVATDTVTFDGNGTGNCSLNVPVSVTSIAVAAGYTGTITANSTGGSPDVQTTTTFSIAAGTFNLNGSTATIGSTLSVTGGTFTAGSGSLTVTTTTTVRGASAIFNAGTAAVTLTGNVAIDTSGTFNAGSGANTKAFSAALTVGAAATQGNFNAGSAVITVGGATTIQGSSTFHAGTSSITTTGSLTVTTATLAAENATIKIGTTTTVSNTGAIDTTTGVTTGSTLTFTGNISVTSSTIDLTGAASTTVSAAVTVNSGATVTMGPTTTIGGALTVAGGTFNSGSNAQTITGTTAINAGGVFNVGSGAVTKTFTARVTVGAAASVGTFNPGTTATLAFQGLTVNDATVDFTGAAATTFTSSVIVNTLGTLTMGPASTIGTNLRVRGASAVFNCGPNALTVNGTTTVDQGGAFTASTTAVTDTFTGATTIGAATPTAGTFNPGTTATLKFSSLTVTDSTVDFTSAAATTFSGGVTVNAAATVTMGPATTIGGNLSVVSGTFNSGSNAQTITGTTSINTGGVFNAGSGAATKTFTGLVTIGAATPTVGTFNPGTTASFSFGAMTVVDSTVDFTNAVLAAWSGAVTVNASGTLTVGPSTNIGGALLVRGASAVFNAGTGAQNVTGNTNVDQGGTYNGSSGTMNFTGTVTVGAATPTSGTFNPGTGTVNFNSAAGTNTFQGSSIFHGGTSKLNVANALTFTTATLYAEQSTIVVTGTATIQTTSVLDTTTGSAGSSLTFTGAFTTTSSTVDFTGANATTFGASMAVNAGATVRMGPAATITTTLLVRGASALLICSGNSLTVNTTTNVDQGGELDAISGMKTFTGAVTIGAATPTAGTFVPGSATLSFGAFNITDSTLNLSGATAVAFTSSVQVNAAATLTMGPATTITTTLLVRGAAALFVGSANSLVVTSTTTVDQGGELDATSGTKTFTGNVAIGAATPTVGTFKPGTADITFSGTLSITDSTVDFTGASSTVFTGNVSVNASATMTMGPAATLSAALTVSGASAVFNASGNALTINGSTTINTGGVFNANTCSNLRLAAGAGAPAVVIGGAATVGAFHANTATIVFVGSSTTGNLVTIQGASTLDAGAANLTFGSGITTAGNNSFNITSGTLDLSNAATLYNFNPGGGAVGGVNVGASGTMKLNATGAAFPRNLASAGTFMAAGGTITVANTLTVSGGTFSASTAAVTVTSTATFSGGTADFSLTTTGPTFNGAVTVSGGTVTLGTGTVGIAGALAVQAGTFNAGGSALTVTGNTTVNSASGSLGTFNANTSNTTFTGSLTIGNGTPTSGAFNCNTATIGFHAVTVQSTSTMDGGSGSNGLTFNTTMTLGNGTTTAGTFNAGSRTGAVIFTGAVAINTASTFNSGSSSNMTFSNTVTLGNATPTAGNFNANSATIAFNNTLTVVSSSIFDGGTSHLTLSAVTIGNATPTSGTFNASSTTATFSGALQILGSSTFNANSSALTINGATTIGNVTAGTFNANSGNVTFSGAFTLQVASSAFNGNTGTGSFGVVTMTAGTFTVADAGSTGRWTLNQSSTFTSGVTLAFPTNKGELSLAPTKTLTVNGPVTSNVGTMSTLPKIDCNGCAGGQGITIAFGATATLNINGLEFDNSVSTGVSIASGATYTLLKRLKFQNNAANSTSTMASHLVITSAKTLLNIPGCYFDATAQYNVTLNGTMASPGVRAIFEFQSTSVNGPRAGDAYDLDADVALPHDNVADNSAAPRWGSVVEWSNASTTDTAGIATGYPVAAFDWNTFTYYGVYVAYKQTGGAGTSSILWNRNEDGTGHYSFTVPAADGDIVGAPVWTSVNETKTGADENGNNNTTDTDVRVVYIGTASGYIIKLIDDGTQLVRPGTNSPWNSDFHDATNVASITSPLVDDGTNLYFGGTNGSSVAKIFGVQVASGANEKTLQKTVGSVGTVTTTPSWTTSSGSTYVYLGSTASMSQAYLYRINMTSGSVDASYTGETTSFNDAVVLINTRAYAVSDAGKLHALDALNFNSGGFTDVTGFPYQTAAAQPIKFSAWIDYATTDAYFGDNSGNVYTVSTAGALRTGFPVSLGAVQVTSSPIYRTGTGVIAVGASDGYLYFIDRSAGAVFDRFFVSSSGTVSSVSYDPHISAFMVASSDGKLVFVNGADVTDPTPGTP
jgi:hypothetical protein